MARAAAMPLRARLGIIRALAALALGLLAVAPARGADDGSLAIGETGVRIAGGVNPSSKIEYYAIHAHAGVPLWQSADRWFSDRKVTARWIVEPWVAFVSDRYGLHQTDSFEIGVSPLFARLIFGAGVLRPFVEGGEGILYTDLRKQDYGTRIQFSSQIGAGLEYRIRPDLAFAFSARLRHTSNGGLASSNPGVNTLSGLVGFTFR
jgi:hypothetical protein